MEASHSTKSEKVSEVVFDNMIIRLTSFVNSHGRYPILKDDHKLYGWISAQMHKYKNNAMKSEHIEKLNRIGFIWNRNDHRWHENAAEVKSLLTENLDNLTYLVNGPLLIWTKAQFALLANGKLDDEKTEVLKQIKPFWVKKNSKQAKEKKKKEKEKERKAQKSKRISAWDKKFNKLVNYRLQNPDTWPTKKSSIEKERKLGVWCFNNRLLYSKFALDDYRLEKLRSINFDFIFDRDVLKAWLDEKKIANKVPIIKHSQVRKTEGRKIQQNKYQKQRLSEGEDFFGIDNVTKLYEVKKWEETCEELKEYIQMHHYIPIKNQNIKLSRWILQQRMTYREGKLSDIRVQKLNEAGLILIPQAERDELWNQKFEELVKFRNEHPDSWPSHHAASPYRKLFEWCQIQKLKLATNSRRKKAYQEDRYMKLQQIDFPFERQIGHIQTWEDIFETLCKYLKYKRGPLQLPFIEKGRETKLSKWLKMQIKMTNDKTLSLQKLRKLKSHKLISPLID